MTPVLAHVAPTIASAHIAAAAEASLAALVARARQDATEAPLSTRVHLEIKLNLVVFRDEDDEDEDPATYESFIAQTPMTFEERFYALFEQLAPAAAVCSPCYVTKLESHTRSLPGLRLETKEREPSGMLQPERWTRKETHGAALACPLEDARWFCAHAHLSHTVAVAPPPALMQARASARRAKCAPWAAAPDSAIASATPAEWFRREHRSLRFAATAAWRVLFTRTRGLRVLPAFAETMRHEIALEYVPDAVSAGFAPPAVARQAYAVLARLACALGTSTTEEACLRVAACERRGREYLGWQPQHLAPRTPYTPS